MLFNGPISHWQHLGPTIVEGEIFAFRRVVRLRGVHVADAQLALGETQNQTLFYYIDLHA
jgi:hypothetical protein